MPKYLVQSPSGQTLELEGDSPPTEKELDDIFAAEAPKDKKAPVVASPAQPDSRAPATERLVAAMDPFEKRNMRALRPTDEEARATTDAVANMGIRSGAGAVGQAAGAATGPFAPVAIPALGAISNAIGEYIALKREGKPASLGKILGAAVTGAIPGAPLAGAGAKAVVREGGKLALGELASATTESVVDRGELPSAGEAAMRTGGAFAGAALSKVLARPAGRSVEDTLNEVRDESFRNVREFGIVVPPSELGKGSNTVASIAGKAPTTQQAAKQNQFGWQKAVREDLGLGRDALPIRESELLALRDQAAVPYREIQTIQSEAKQQLEEHLTALSREADPHAAAMALDQPAMKESISILTTLAAADVNALKESRKAMQRSRKAFFNGDPSAYEPWQKAKAESDALEGAIERAAVSLKDDKLLSRLRESRAKIAKTYSVEDALNPGNGFVDPAVFGRQVLNGEPLTGNLEKIAKFQLAFRREAVEAGRVPAPGVGNLGSMLTTGMASQGDAPGMIGAVANATLGRAIRPFLLSDFVQDAMLSPQERQNFSAQMARFLAEQEAEGASEPAEVTSGP